MFRSRAAPDRRSISRHHSTPSGELRSVAPTPFSPPREINATPVTRGIFRSNSCNDAQSPTKPVQRRSYLFGGNRQQQEQPKKVHATITPPASPNGDSLPCPKSYLRVTFRRKATKGPKKRKSRTEEEVIENYNDDGVLERTTITRTKKPDGSTSLGKHRERIIPTNPRYPQNKSVKARREVAESGGKRG
jgi:hypothetical protein